MNVRNWNKKHTFGLLIGVLSPLVMIPLILFVVSKTQNFYFEQLWFKFMHNDAAQGKMISLSIIPNLIWFYWNLNRERYNFAMGVIVGSALYLPYILYLTFF
jgi:hypothetical protein